MRSPGVIFCLPLLAAFADSLQDGTEKFRQNDYVTALLLLEPLAKEGNSQAQMMVGSMFFYGLGVTEDSEAGLDWIGKAARRGEAEAQEILGNACLEGRGLKQDYAEARKWLTKAADQGNASAERSLGEIYEKGLGVPKDEAEAKKWKEKARKQPELPNEITEGLASSSSITLFSLQPWGGPDIPQWAFYAHHILGRMELSPHQAKVAVAALKAALAAGDANITSMCLIEPRHALAFKADGNSFEILICYQCGQIQLFKNEKPLPFQGMIGGTPDILNALLKAAGIPLADNSAALRKSYREEAKIALKLAQEGDLWAQGVIARMFMQGRGVTKDETEGIKWLSESMGSAPDQANFQVALAKMYRDDQFLGKDPKKAMTLFRQAAAQGSAEAEYQIGELHEFGEGVPRNAEQALKWYRKSAENGYANAQLELGVRYAQGREVGRDYAEALRWLRKAADQSHPQALAWMGNMYQEGWGVPKDQSEAYFWDRLAVEYQTIYGHRIPFQPTPEQFSILQKRLADWIAAHPKPADAQ